jgi:hypothetical protein
MDVSFLHGAVKFYPVPPHCVTKSHVVFTPCVEFFCTRFIHPVMMSAIPISIQLYKTWHFKLLSAPVPFPPLRSLAVTYNIMMTVKTVQT